MKIYKLNTVLNFGRYKGYALEDVIEDNPNYIAWAVDESDWFKLDEQAERALEVAISNAIFEGWYDD